MTAYARHGPKSRRQTGRVPLLLSATLVLLAAATSAFVSYMLWPTWPDAALPLDAPPVPVTVAGVLFNVPPAAIRAAVQRSPGAHERIDFALDWPSLTPPADGAVAAKAAITREAALPEPPRAADRLFVTVAGLGAVLAPTERLRTIYPRYIEAQATAGPEGLATVAFRAGTPYESEDLVYFADNPEQFFARCTRASGPLPGTCVHERTIGAAELTLRFSRNWLRDWRSVAAGFDRLMTQLHPQAVDARRKPDDK